MSNNKHLLDIFLKQLSVCTDTRKLVEGDIYFALRGPNFNGNQFALQALQNGASFAVIDDETIIKNLNIDLSQRLIVVQNSLQALQQLARDYRKKLNIPVIALTGSNGKTTTKELIAEVLRTKYKINFTVGNLNNEIGVPLTMLTTKSDVEILIVEMGANHQGEIDLLSNIATPDYGIITNIGKAHLEGFGGEEGVKKGKSELFRFLQKSQGTIFFNNEDSIIKSVIPDGIKAIPYNPSDFTIEEHSTFLNLWLDGKQIKTNFVGNYNVNNIAAAFCIGKYFGLEEKSIISAIENYQPKNNRSQLEIIKGVQVVKDAYNANPSSIKASLQSFLSENAENKVVVLGDMLELGVYADSEHKSVIDFLIKYDIFDAVLIGNEFYRHKNPKYKFYQTTTEAKLDFKLEDYVGKTLLLKGSRGIALEKLLEE